MLQVAICRRTILHKRMQRFRFAWSTLLALLCLGAATLDAQQKPNEFELKAVYLFDFGKFMRLTAEGVAARPARTGNFDICMIGEDPLGPVLTGITANERIDGRPVRVLTNKTAADARSCDIAYISSSEGGRLNADVESLADSDVLTVSDVPAFLERGGMIQFVLQGNRVRFSVNMDAVYRTHIRLSAQLLRVAVAICHREDQAGGGAMSFFWNARSISGKLTRLIVLVTSTALLLSCVSFLAYDLYTYRQGAIRSLSTEAQIVGSNSVSALTFDDRQAAENTLNGLRNSTQVLAAVIYDADGELFAQYIRDAEASGRSEIQPLLNPQQVKGYWSRGPNILLGSRISFQGKPLGSVYILAETTDLNRRAEQYLLISIGILALCLLISLLATARIRHLVADPLTGLAETAQIVSRKKDYSVRAKPPREGDELAFLVESFNEMLEQIQQRDRALLESRNVLEQRVDERTSELTAANKELEAFSYSVAHDLRGPLDVIGNIGYLLRDTAAQDKDTQELITGLLDGSKRMSSLIEDLLNLSRATSTSMHRIPVNMTAMVDGIVRSLQAGDHDRKVHFTVAAGARVIADEGLLCIVMENLLRNAWKYSSRVDAAEIEFGFKEEQGRTVFFICDNGAGFDPRYADRLFRPFQRLHSQSEFPGTGVGLATVKRIITRHGGQIWAQSNVGQGATFFFTIPYEITA